MEQLERRWTLADGKTLHRENNLPAIERMNGSKEWWVNGRRHRTNGFPAIEWANGSCSWYVNGRPVEPLFVKTNDNKFNCYFSSKTDKMNWFSRLMRQWHFNIVTDENCYGENKHKD